MSHDILVRLASHLKEQLDNGLLSCLDPYMATLSQLSKLDVEQAKGAQVRTRIHWVEEGEVSPSFFFSLERKRGSDRRVSALRLPNGSIVSSPTDLCSSFRSFYQDLFTGSATDSAAQASLFNNISATLPSHLADLCEGELSYAEVHQALVGMARSKAPGSDGLPMEFYLRFWDLLGSDLGDVLNSCFRSGSLSLSQRSSVISLVFKKRGRLDPRNWRPISLLNDDYKLASRSLAGRLLKVIHVVVNSDQTCGVPGRFIGENVALLRDVVDFASCCNDPVAILSLDQEKAFDRVDWHFMDTTLRTMGLGPSFVLWVKLFYSGARSCINVNGYLSSFFSLSRGVRQGCPLSSLPVLWQKGSCHQRPRPF